MKLTTESIIKMLPFEVEFKKQLIEGWGSLSSDQKYAITMALWNLYNTLYEITFDKNLEQAFLLAQEDKEKMDKDLYDRVKAKTEQEMQQMGTTEAATIDLSSTRDELAKILNEVPQEQTPQDEEQQVN